MFADKINKENNKNLGKILITSNKVLNIIYFLLLALGLYLGLKIIKELDIHIFVFKIFGILTPLFFGFIISWLLEPIVDFLTKKKINRGLATILTFLGFIIILIVAGIIFVPMIIIQINDLVSMIPSTVTKLTDSINDFITNSVQNENVSNKITNYFLTTITSIGTSTTTNLPNFSITLVQNILSSIVGFAFSTIIGFYLLFKFNNTSNSIVSLVPNKSQKDVKKLLNIVNGELRAYVGGVLTVSLALSLISSLIFALIGLKAPLLFGFICGITNLIPYIGPYIGGAIALIAAFTINPTVVVLTLITVVILQLLESFILQPIIIGKTMKLHPVTVIVSLLVFGNFFGIIGMIVAVPIISTTKVIFTYLNNKYKIIGFNKFDFEEDQDQ
ncbi:MAG: AI-2E family transporter [Bacilli bacterium]